MHQSLLLCTEIHVINLCILELYFCVKENLFGGPVFRGWVFVFKWLLREHRAALCVVYMLLSMPSGFSFQLTDLSLCRHLFTWLTFLTNEISILANRLYILLTACCQRNKGGVVITDDEYFTADEAEYTEHAEYAEKMPFHEALFASIFSSTTVTNTSSSIEGPTTSELSNFKKKVEITSQVFCEICLENKESWQMFRNDKCSHSFCCECTTNHIIAKIQDRVKRVTCPAPNCKARLNKDICRLMIPEYALVQWDELLCLSLIKESSKLYCPFQDCSAMLINDSGLVVQEVQCVSCKRWFCAECRVPWHMEFTCKEFQKWYAKKGGKDDKIVKKLAKKKNWQKCPKCKMYVEKSEGCIHMTCRCKYQFCYRCGSKWSDSHGGKCRQR